MGEKWYWKHRGELKGPFDTEDIASLIRQKRIFDRDRLRLDGDERWISGRQIKEMFSVKPASESGKSAANSRVAQDPASYRGYEISLPSVSLEGVFGFFADRLAILFLPFMKLLLFCCNRRVLLAGTVAILLIVFGFKMWGGSSRFYHTAFQQLMTTWDDFERLRIANAPDQEWVAIRSTKTPDLDVLIKQLQENASKLPPGPHDVGSRNWRKTFISRKLLSASQTLRESMSRLPKYDLEKTNFSSELSDARDLLMGVEFRATQNLAEAQNARNPRLNQENDEPNVIVAAIIIVDVLLVAAGVYWFFLRPTT